MARPGAKLIAVFLALAMIVAACSSSSSDDASDGGDGASDGTAPTDDGSGDDGSGDDSAADTGSGDDGSTDDGSGDDSSAPVGNTVGITDEGIVISVLRSDTADLQERGVIPDVGDPVQNFEVFAQLANEAGGAGGHDIIVTSHLYPPGATATDQQPSCLQATEDDEAFIVVFVGGMAAETVLCVTEQHDRIAYALSGVLVQSVYDRSEGRLFNHAMSADRLMATWVAVLDEQGILDGATLGLVRHDQSDHEEAAQAVAAELEARGYELAEEVAVPCEGTSCGQTDIAVERLDSAGVDHVFSLMGAIQYSTVVGAAESAEYRPRWLSSDFENQAFDSTAAFMRGVSANYDGAWGVSAGLDVTEPDAFRTDCNARFSEVTGTVYEPLNDAWGAVGSMCYIVDRIVEAANDAEAAGGLTQESFIAALETQDFMLGDNVGRWTPDKHDAVDSYVLKQWSADCICWNEVEGSRGLLE